MGDTSKDTYRLLVRTSDGEQHMGEPYGGQMTPGQVRQMLDMLVAGAFADVNTLLALDCPTVINPAQVVSVTAVSETWVQADRDAHSRHYD